ncbi:MAG: glycine reductase [Eggerthellaceae bacterium]|nr:glycine reductase [Eggerthellaceae bacterium]
MSSLEKKVASIFMEMADGVETGQFGGRPKIALTGMGSEHGEENSMAAAVEAAAAGIDVQYIGTLENAAVTTVKVADDEEGHAKMDELLNSGEIDGAVTMHYPFPIGVSTVGRVITPARGKEMFVATTTGTSSSDRIEGMILNAIYGIITAKASGIANPTVGILNVDGARQTEMALKEIAEAGYPITFCESSRADGGCVLRGNDVLQGTPDVLVTDSLTGNVLIKMLSAFQTGGSFEATGYGYGPGIGKDYDKLVLIISRASGAPLIAIALNFAGQLVKGGVFKIAAAEFAAAEKAGLAKAIEKRKASAKPAAEEAETVEAPPKEPCTSSIPGIEVMDLEDAVQVLWKAGIYAESGMGCTGPLVMMSDANAEKAAELLKEAGFIA